MGCDIHPILERRARIDVAGVDTEVWVGVQAYSFMMRFERIGTEWKTSYWGGPAIKKRNYRRFGMLANVRGDGPPPKGIPDDASFLTKMMFLDWGGDGHSHSWNTLEEALKICLASESDPHNVFFAEGDPRKEYPLMYFFGLDEVDDMANYRLVYCFDN
mgnify:FL=1